ncbi:MAG: type II secretion system ATPase GspE [Thermodesulfobacteriota bacterium]|nr:type II secretion system ATPase GspE [Thermodesulfobacteriota bacterium]
MHRRKIGEILIEDKGVSKESFERALLLQKEERKRIGEILIQEGIIKEHDLLDALSIQFKMPYFNKIEGNGVDSAIISSIPINFAKRNKLIPIEVKSGKMIVAVADPINIQPLDDLRVLFDLRIESVISNEREIQSAINRYYEQASNSPEEVIQDMNGEDSTQILSELEEAEAEDLLDVTSEAPVIKLVNLILSQAIKSRASDIHIEPYQKDLRIRYRIDGVLYNILTPPKRYQLAIVSRVKIMAKLNIAEKRLPQDGRFRIKIADKDIDVRVSVIPTTFGERVVLRLLDKSNLLLELENLGLAQNELDKINRLIYSSHGIILVTGPTGSGKTTTLYAALNEINSPEKNIITIEDPIEYQLNGIGQIQVNTKIDLTFAKGLRSIVRQDPDVILVGEIRDSETAEIAIHAALTGHLVFSTLHTNDAAGAITRLTDMGIEPFLVSSSLNAVIAQRLVRLICEGCKESYAPDKGFIKEIGLRYEDIKGGLLYRGKGCQQCLHTGYRGRKGIYEIMNVDDSIQSLILKTSESNIIRNKGKENGMITLREAGAQAVLDGITTIEEVLRVTQE